MVIHGMRLVVWDRFDSMAADSERLRAAKSDLWKGTMLRASTILAGACGPGGAKYPGNSSDGIRNAAGSCARKVLAWSTEACEDDSRG